MTRICRAVIAAGALALPILVASAGLAQPLEAGDGDAALARRHFKNGVRLHEDENHAGALAEFEAAYRLKPSAASLQNVALSLKALFRYAEAADTLRQLLERHPQQLSEDERTSLRQAIDELESLVGSVIVTVTPPDARVSIDGRSIAPDRYRQGVRLNVGEHSIVAEAPGYDRVSRVVRIAGGHSAVPVEIVLTPRMGFVSVVTTDPEAAIAIDGDAMAFERWRGPTPPGRHYVQVYKKGFQTFEKVINVELGQTVTVEVPELMPAEEDEVDPVPSRGNVETRQLTGFYALFVLNLGGYDQAPAPRVSSQAPAGTRLEHERVSAGSAGFRAGYRIWTPIGVEGLLEAGRYRVDDACVQGPNHVVPCDGSDATVQDYVVESVRVGGNLRLMSGGERVRFTSGAGVGAVRHRVEMGRGPFDGDVASGFDPFFTLELGVQTNLGRTFGADLGHVLLEADVFAYFEGASEVRSGQWAPYAEADGLQIYGLSLRAGWGEWKPARKDTRP
jgi:hypothetical protein